MKKISFLINIVFVLIVCSLAKAQEMDQSKLIVNYHTIAVRDTIRKDVVTDDLNLLIGKSYSLYYSTKWEALKEEYKGYTLDANPLNVVVLNSGTRNIILNNYKNGQLQTLEPLKRDNYTYIQSNTLLQWKIETKTKVILGYNCQKAVAKYGGRVWTAWFTTDVPLSEGPWVFKGLPGLILEVVDSQSYFKFNAVALERKQIPMIFSDKGFTQTTREKVKEVLKSYHVDLVQRNINFENSFSKLIKETSPEQNDRRLSGLAYNPIDREQKSKKSRKK